MLVSIALGSATVYAEAPADFPRALAEARAREATVDYAGALRVLAQAIARGGANPAQYIELHLLAGQLAAGLDRAREAEGHFARVLALSPERRLAAGTSPKITAPFDAALARNVPLSIIVVDDRGLVRIRPTKDPLALVAGISVHVVDRSGTHRDIVDRRSTRITIPAGTSVVEVTALDADGHHIWISAGAPPVVTRDVVRVAPATHPRGWHARWTTWAVVSGVTIATGGFAAWRFAVAQDDFDALRSRGTYDELRDVENRGGAWGLTANIAFGAAAASGIAAVILFAVEDDTPVYVDPSERIVGVAGRF